MSPISRVLLIAGAGAVLADAPPELRVLRAAPVEVAAPTAAITVTFDRPVAGSLDRSVDPSGLLTLSPAVPGVTDWRDPVTLRFRPAAPLPSNTSFRVTVSDGFAAMDGSRLARPYSFAFRVRGPRVLTGDPLGPRRAVRWLKPDAAFTLVVDAPLTDTTARGVFIEMAKTCARPGVVRLRLAEQRTVTPRDPYSFREAGGWDRDRSSDSLRRVLRFVPETPLPRGCSGDLILPTSFDEVGRGSQERWQFSTYGAFNLTRVACGWPNADACPTGPVLVTFSNPVKGSEVVRHLRIFPAAPFTVSDTADARAEWALETRLSPRTSYAISADTALRDVFAQRLTGNPAAPFRTSGFQAAINYTYGRAIVEREGLRTLGVTHINVDTLDVAIVPVPDSLVPFFMGNEWRWGEHLPSLFAAAPVRRVPVRNDRDRARVYGVELPAPDARRPGSPVLMAVRVSSRRLPATDREHRPTSLVQVTNLGVHARIGPEEGAVWVTGANDGLPRAGARVLLRDRRGRQLASATSDSLGLARLTSFRSYPVDSTAAPDDASVNGYVDVTLGADRALAGIHDYDPDLSPWRFNVSPAWGPERLQSAGAVFTERGIYRPGEPLYAKAIVRTGMLGQLEASRDSVRWIFRNREGDGAWRDTVTSLSAFGTAEQRVVIPADARLGDYRLAAQVQRRGEWVEIAGASYRIAEYRPPEFLVDVNTPGEPRYGGDSLRATVEARYLFGAPMGRAAVAWQLRQVQLPAWELEIPNTEGFFLGETGRWWEELSEERAQTREERIDTLDGAGRLQVAAALGGGAEGQPSRATLAATVTDVNRQTVSASASVVVHPAAFYLGAKPAGTEYFWRANGPAEVAVIAVRPDGERLAGVRVTGVLERQEWHRVRRERGGYAEEVGEWVTDTVARCALVTAGGPETCRVIPPAGGAYTLRLTATDVRGRKVITSFHRWAVGADWVPWNDESQFRMDVVPDRTRYTAGDTATVLFASPFTNAEAWVTVEREGLIEQRRIRITSGTTTLRFLITEAHAPNVFVSIVVARGRSARPGPLDDPGRPTIRVGYAELRVTPERKRLSVEVKPLATEYRPGDSARIRLRVQDAKGAGQRSEVTLWAVDEGVLALTGFRTPDPIDLIYRPRGLGLRLASTLTRVAPQVPPGEKGGRNPGGGGGAGDIDVLRSRFQATAFFLGSVITNASGEAVASTKLPDNLTTFRLMAVAVTMADRYGSGDAPMLVTKPLLARPALPRFTRPGDRLTAGIVVNHRAGGTPTVKVKAQATGARLSTASSRSVRLAAGRGSEVRFGFTAADGDSARFRFDVSGERESDAVRLALPVRPAFHSRSYVVAGVLRDTASAEFALPEGIDPKRSRLSLSFGTSALPMLRQARQWFEVYPYACSEQVASGIAPLIALAEAQRAYGEDSLPGNVRGDIARAVTMLERRQRTDGGIGLWNASSWSSPWLTAYVGLVLLDAKASGVPVSDSVLARISRYMKETAPGRGSIFSPLAAWYSRNDLRLSDRVAAVEFLSRIGRRDRAAENELVRTAAQLAWEDRVRLARVLALGGDLMTARGLLEPAWATVRVEGRRAVLPAAARREFYIYSPVRPAAWLLSATLAVDPSHPLVGPLVEALVVQGRGAEWRWNTQDFGTVARALADFQRLQAQAASRLLRVRAGRHTVISTAAAGAGRDASVSLDGLLARRADGAPVLRLTLDSPQAPAGAPIFYFLTVTEVPLEQPVRPDYQGVVVERWYENYRDGKPVTNVVEGELVRVRLKVTVTAERSFVVLDDALPAGLEAIDLSLRTAGGLPGPGAPDSTGRGEGENRSEDEAERFPRWGYGSWDGGWWSPWEHRELRDDRVVYFATVLWPGTYTATYVARATTAGVFVRPPTHVEEMYNPAVFGRTDGGVFTVSPRP